MRHLFDQYSQPENRLTHALVMGLAQDQSLLKIFIRRFTKQRIPPKTKFHIVEQSIPGEIENSEEEAGKKGLPDAWIYTDEGWSLLIESKISATLDSKQLTRHLKTAIRRGFHNPILMVLATEEKLKRLPENVIGVPWTDVYEWLSMRNHNSVWAKQITSFMEIVEAKMEQEKYLKEGTLTKFSGIPFSRDNPFTYLEGKRLLGLILDKLKERKNIKKLGVDPKLSGRPAIKAFKGSSVWDFMKLKVSSKSQNFTKYPHLTVGVHSDHVRVLVTLPNAVERSIRKRIFKQGREAFFQLVLRIAMNMKKVTKIDPAAQPYIQVIQRHYPSQSSPPVEDAILKYDIRTVLKNGGKVQKFQPQWIQATYDVMTSKKSNIQFEFGVIFPYRESKVVNTSKALDVFEQAFIAMKPFLDTAIKGK